MVCELEGPIPVLKIERTDLMGSPPLCDKLHIYIIIPSFFGKVNRKPPFDFGNFVNSASKNSHKKRSHENLFMTAFLQTVDKRYRICEFA